MWVIWRGEMGAFWKWWFIKNVLACHMKLKLGCSIFSFNLFYPLPLKSKMARPTLRPKVARYSTGSPRFELVIVVIVTRFIRLCIGKIKTNSVNKLEQKEITYHCCRFITNVYESDVAFRLSRPEPVHLGWPAEKITCACHTKFIFNY